MAFTSSDLVIELTDMAQLMKARIESGADKGDAVRMNMNGTVEYDNTPSKMTVRAKKTKEAIRDSVT